MTVSAPIYSVASLCVSKSIVAGLIIFLVAPALPPKAHAQGSAVRVESFNLVPNGQVRIENPLGATRVEAWTSRTVRVVAEKKLPAGSALNPAELVLMGAQNTILIQCRQVAAGTRIDLVVYVPPGTHLQIVGSSWPVDVAGSMASSVVETTSGGIEYQLPRGDDARVVMHSVRGAVKSTYPLVVTEKVGSRSLQGTSGSGKSPLMLSSQSGRITLSSSERAVAILTDEPEGMSARRGGGATTAESVAASQQPGSRGAPRRDDLEDDPSSIATPPSQRATGGGASGSPQRSSMILSQSGRDTQGSEVTRGGGPFVRPRHEEESSAGSSGLSVRIIPANPPPSRPRRDNTTIYDDPKDQRTGNRTDDSAYSGRARSSETETDTNAGVARRPSRAQPLPEPEDPRLNEPPELRRTRPSDESPDAGGRSDAWRPPSSEEEPIVLESALVNLNVAVTDRAGVALASLKKEDFLVFENGEGQQIDFFQTGTSPFNLVLLLDLSGSIKDKLDVVKSAALKFLEVLGPEDSIAVVTFTDTVRVISQFTKNRDLLRRRIKEIDKPEGGTMFYEAMWFSLVDTLRGTRGQRNAIVVMTDGVDSSLDRYDPAPTRVSFERLAARLEESDTIVFPIYLDTEYDEVFKRMQSTAEAYVTARQQLAYLAQLTGGQMFQAEEAKDLAGVYRKVAAALRTVYSIGYYPTNPEKDGSFRRVRVTVDRSDAAVRTRRGYYAR